MRLPRILIVLTSAALLAGCAGSASLDDAALVTGSPTASSSASSASPSASASAAPSVSPSAGGSASASPSESPSASATASASGATASPSASPTSSDLGMKLWENIVSIYLTCDCTTFGNLVSFTWDGGYAITSPQPWTGVTTANSGKAQQLNLQVGAGRKGSQQVADWFNARAPYVTDQYSNLSGPSSLNFAFSGTLTLNGLSMPVVLGQGYSAFQNMWWIGGPNFTNSTNEVGITALAYAIDNQVVNIYGGGETGTMFEAAWWSAGPP